METARSTYTLNAQQYEQVLAILQREQQARTPSPWQERIFKLLNIAISGLGIVVSIPILILLLFLAAKFIPGLEKAADFLAGIAFIFIVIAYLPLGLLAVGILILFSLNLPYVRRLVHQRRLVRRLGLLEALRAPWETERRKKRLRNALDLGVSILGPLLIAAVGFLIGIIDLFNRPDNVFLPLGVLLLSCMLGGAIIATYFVRRSKERLGLISHLSASLERQKEEVEQKDDLRVQIPAETYETVAQIERAQISRERVQSILGSLEEPGTSP